MRKRDEYKRLIMFLASVLIIALQTGVFAYAWFHDYYDKDIIGRMYGYWGHWALLWYCMPCLCSWYPSCFLRLKSDICESWM